MGGQGIQRGSQSPTSTPPPTSGFNTQWTQRWIKGTDHVFKYWGMLVLRLYQLVHKRYPHGSEPSHVLLPPHRTSTNITTHHTCFQCMGNADYPPHLPTTNIPPAPSTAWNAVSFSYLLTINTPTHPLQHGSQCRPATCPPSTPHATLIQQHFLDHNSSAWNTEFRGGVV